MGLSSSLVSGKGLTYRTVRSMRTILQRSLSATPSRPPCISDIPLVKPLYDALLHC